MGRNVPKSGHWSSARCSRPPLLATQNGKKVHLLAAVKCTADFRRSTNLEGPNRPSRLARMSGHHLNLDPDAVASARLTMYSQVAQEVEYILLVGCTQHIELRNHLVGFRAVAGMLLDGGQQVVGTPVMQEEDALPHTP
jgi:hypothetical protein